MKTGILIFTIIATAFAVEKPGNCPAELVGVSPNVGTQQTCVSDFDCMGTEKCCGQMCVPPECNLDVVPAQCLLNPCQFAECSSVPGAKCFQDPCSERCEVFWLTEDRDATAECLNNEVEEEERYDDDDDDDEDEFVDDDDDDDDVRALTWKERKERRIARKQAFLKRKAEKIATKTQAIEDRRTAKIEKWDKKGKQNKIERFQERWENKDVALQEKLEVLKAKKLARKQARKQAKRERKQQKKQMSPEELEAFKAQMKEDRLAKKAAKLERKQEMKEQLKGRINGFKAKKIEKKRARMERRQRRKMMAESQ